MKRSSFSPLWSFTPAQRERLKEILGEEGFKRAVSPIRGRPRAINLAPTTQEEMDFRNAEGIVGKFLHMMDIEGARRNAMSDDKLRERHGRIRGTPSALDQGSRPKIGFTREVLRMSVVARDLAIEMTKLRRRVVGDCPPEGLTDGEALDMVRREARRELMKIISAWNNRLLSPRQPSLHYLPALCRRCARPILRRPSFDFCSDNCRRNADKEITAD
jgi:hypothetical protein